ncbi:MAG: magnesium and cobalt transport protein CorA, partial [Fulvivirga sp.]
MHFNLPDLTNLPKLVFPRSGTATKTAGLPPGQLIHLGEKITDKSTIDLIHYHDSEFDEAIFLKAEDALSKITEFKVNWLNIDGLHNVNLVEKVGEHFDINPLVLEDVL